MSGKILRPKNSVYPENEPFGFTVQLYHQTELAEQIKKNYLLHYKVKEFNELMDENQHLKDSSTDETINSLQEQLENKDYAIRQKFSTYFC